MARHAFALLSPMTNHQFSVFTLGYSGAYTTPRPAASSVSVLSRSRLTVTDTASPGPTLTLSAPLSFTEYDTVMFG